MRTAVGLIGVEQWYGGDLTKLAEPLKVADDMGIDKMVVVDHVVMGENIHKYPYGPFPGTIEFPWLEPMVQLGAFASLTKRIKLCTGILINPLRAAALAAKQIATLDYLSNGRVEIGLGTGWQQEEYIACGVPWEGRFEHMEEQVRVWRKLWSEAPTSFHGKYANFDKIWCLPFPKQGKDIPILFGIAPTDRNIARIADVGDGWTPLEMDPAKLAEPIQKLRTAFQARGRDPRSLEVQCNMAPVTGKNGRFDLDATLANVPAYRDIGITTLQAHPPLFCESIKDFGPFLEKVQRAVKG
jgi:probable F420-dependent oxidoreductase